MIAERGVRRIKEGTSAVVLQSRLEEKWWADSMECYTYLRNKQDLLSDGTGVRVYDGTATTRGLFRQRGD